MKRDGTISHHGQVPAEDEELSPTLENVIVFLWLRSINPGLPWLVKQRYGTELRSKTIATIKQEISLVMDSLLEELNALQDSKVLRTALHTQQRDTVNPNALLLFALYVNKQVVCVFNTF